MSHPTDNLVRMIYDTNAVELRADDDGDGRTLFGHFAVFNRWTEINSWYEGRFLEQIERGTFVDTFAAQTPKVLYDHGHDPSIGNKPLGAPDVLREDKIGAYYEVPLLDSPYVNELLPAIREGLLGASFRFKVTGERWDEPKRATQRNPEKLPERTITKAVVYEFGPVTFPAYADASAGVRSGTDSFVEHLLADEDVLARYIERVGINPAAKFLASLPTPLGRNDAPVRDVPASLGGSGSDDALAIARAKARATHALLTV